MITKKQFIKNVVKYSEPLKDNQFKVIDYLKVKGIKACREITFKLNHLSIEDKKEFIQIYFKVGLVIYYKGFFFIYDNKKEI